MNARIVLALVVAGLAAGCDPPPAGEPPDEAEKPAQAPEPGPAPAPEAPAPSSEGTIGLGNIGTIGHGGGGGFSKSKCRVRHGPHEVRGAISKENVRRVIRLHINEIRFCYQQGLDVEPDLEGLVRVGCGIDPTGAVVDPEIQKSTLESKDVLECIVKAFDRWTFPAPEDGKAVTLKVRYVFEPPEEDPE
jgi:hypothetical protein